jgi:hypothetical protein
MPNRAAGKRPIITDDENRGLTEPGASFYDAAIKVRWANYLIRELSNRSDAWLSTSSTAIATRVEHRSSIVTITAPKDTFWTYFTVAADICHNLRNSLDYCWMGLIRAATPEGRTPRRETFPIGRDRVDLQRLVDGSPVGDARDQVSAYLLDQLGAHGDLQDGGSRDLKALNYLSNWQKHNRLPVIDGTLLIEEARLAAPGGYSLVKRDITLARGEQVEMQIPQPGGVFSMPQRPEWRLGLSGNEAVEGREVSPTLRELSQFARGVIDDFTRMFPETVHSRMPKVFGPGYDRQESDDFIYL